MTDETVSSPPEQPSGLEHRRHLDPEALARVSAWGMAEASRFRAEGNVQHANQVLREIVHRGVTPAELLDVYDDLLRQLSLAMREEGLVGDDGRIVGDLPGSDDDHLSDEDELARAHAQAEVARAEEQTGEVPGGTTQDEEDAG